MGRRAVLAIAVAAFAWPAACGDDAASESTATASGTGGAVVASASHAASAGGSAELPICERACDKIATQCGLGPVCEAIEFLDCAHPDVDCSGQCILDAECSAIVSLTSTRPDQVLLDCLQTCLGFQACSACLGAACDREVQSCEANPACVTFIACVEQCTEGSCVDDCAAAHPSAEADVLIACATRHCNISCQPGSGGASGAGGGTGGAGGN